MPRLANSQHETFAANVAAGFSLTEAARRADYARGTEHNVGSRLAKDNSIAQRIRELRVTSDPDLIASKQWVIAEAIENQRLARKLDDIATANQCLQFIAKLQGYLVERRESYAERINIRELKVGDITRVLSSHYASLPDADRAQIVDAEPEIAGLIGSAENSTIAECTDQTRVNNHTSKAQTIDSTPNVESTSDNT